MSRKNTRDNSVYMEIASKYKNGTPCTDLSKQYQFSETHILRIIRKHGVDVRDSKSCHKKTCLARRRFTQDQEKMVCQFYESGKTMREIGDIMGCGFGHISHVLKRYNMKTRLSLASGKRGIYTSRWTGDIKYDHKGHRRIQIPGHPTANKGGWMYEHRYIMEQHLGRPLRNNEVVHHINGIPDDNDIRNLQILTSSEHTQLHNAERKLAA